MMYHLIIYISFDHFSLFFSNFLILFLRLHNSLYYVDKTQNFLRGLLVFFYHFRIDRAIKTEKYKAIIILQKKKNKYKLTLTTLFILFCILPKLKFFRGEINCLFSGQCGREVFHFNIIRRLH